MSGKRKLYPYFRKNMPDNLRPDPRKLSSRKKKNRGLSLRANYTDLVTDYRLSAKIVSTLTERWCGVVSTTDPYGHILGFSTDGT
jgi:hypothetical protein